MLNPLGWLRNRNPEKVQRNVMLDAFMRDVIVALTASCESTLGKDMWDTLPFFNVDYMNAEAVHEVIDDIGKNNPMLNVPAVEVDEMVACRRILFASKLGVACIKNLCYTICIESSSR